MEREKMRLFGKAKLRWIGLLQVSKKIKLLHSEREGRRARRLEKGFVIQSIYFRLKSRRRECLT